MRSVIAARSWCPIPISVRIACGALVAYARASSTDLVGCDAGQLGDPLGRVGGGTLAELVEPDRVPVEVVGVVEPLREDHVHQAERERGVGARPRAHVPVGRPGRARLDRVDHHDPGAAPPRLGDEGPQVLVGDDRVRPPEDDEAAVAEILREHPLRAALRRRDAARRAPSRRSRASGASRPSSAKKRRSRERRLDDALGAHVAVREHRLAAGLGHDRTEPAATSSSASSQPTRSNRPSPFAPTRRSGWSTRSGL